MNAIRSRSRPQEGLEMSILQGKGIWTLYDDVASAVSTAPQVGADFIIAKVSNRGIWSQSQVNAALALIRSNADLVPVAWTYTYLEDVNAEAQCVKLAFQAGVAAYILDAEV